MLKRGKRKKGFIGFYISQLDLVRFPDETLKWKVTL
jgi:hypothetical protein